MPILAKAVDNPLLTNITKMELENQVCSLDLAKRLKELGVKQESLFWWSVYTGFTKVVSQKRSVSGRLTYYSAYSVAELLQMLLDDKKLVELYQNAGQVMSQYFHTDCYGPTAADALAELIIKLHNPRTVGSVLQKLGLLA